MPLDQVLVRKATNLTTGYSFVGIDSDRGSVWDASKSAYGTTISAASFALGGSENGSLHYLVEPSEVRKLQGTKLQLASFGSTRLKGEGFAAAAQQVSEASVDQKKALFSKKRRFLLSRPVILPNKVICPITTKSLSFSSQRLQSQTRSISFSEG